MLEIGTKGRAEVRVTEQNTAAAMGSGTLPVFATPALVALAEQTCWQSVSAALEPGSATVGTGLELRHTAPTPLGGTVICESELTAVAGRALTFSVKLHDAEGPVGEGVHTRAVVDAARFLKKAEGRAK